jgi:PAS domain S-box-containing protein
MPDFPTDPRARTLVGEREHDDVERHQEEETVAETAESLLTFENAALPLSVISPAGDLVMTNRAMRALLGYQFSDLIGKSVFDVVVADPSELTRAWAAHIRGGARVTPERAIRLRRADGAELNVRVSSVLVTDSQGTVRYIVTRAVPDQP